MSTAAPDHVRKIREQREALAAYDAGIPSTLPEGNRFRAAVESHRWGRHGESDRRDRCPVCARVPRR